MDTATSRNISRRTLLAAAGAGMVGLVAGFATGRVTAPAAAPPPTLTLTNRLRRRAQPDAIFRVDTDQPLVALTFDDGPDPAYTPRILDVLAARHVRATFFVVGVNALAHRDLLKREVAAGHSIGNHTRTHPDLERLGPEEVLAEIDGGEDDIVAAGAPRPTLFRPPKGLTDEIVAIFADAERYRTVFWDLAVEHFVRHLGVDEGVRRLLARVRPGSIILAHDGGHTPGRPVIDRDQTLAALPLLLEGLARLGLRPVDVPALLHAARRTD